jgi:hypothetical protein
VGLLAVGVHCFVASKHRGIALLRRLPYALALCLPAASHGFFSEHPFMGDVWLALPWSIGNGLLVGSLLSFIFDHLAFVPRASAQSIAAIGRKMSLTKFKGATSSPTKLNAHRSAGGHGASAAGALTHQGSVDLAHFNLQNFNRVSEESGGQHYASGTLAVGIVLLLLGVHFGRGRKSIQDALVAMLFLGIGVVVLITQATLGLRIRQAGHMRKYLRLTSSDNSDSTSIDNDHERTTDAARNARRILVILAPVSVLCILLAVVRPLRRVSGTVHLALWPFFACISSAAALREVPNPQIDTPSRIPSNVVVVLPCPSRPMAAVVDKAAVPTDDFVPSRSVFVVSGGEASVQGPPLPGAPSKATCVLTAGGKGERTRRSSTTKPGPVGS